MKVLLDENLPVELRKHLTGFDAFTVAYLGWKGVKNGELLRRADAAGFDAFLTLDNGIPFQQNLTNLKIRLMIIRARSNHLDDLLPLVPALIAKLPTVQSGGVLLVP